MTYTISTSIGMYKTRDTMSETHVDIDLFSSSLSLLYDDIDLVPIKLKTPVGTFEVKNLVKYYALHVVRNRDINKSSLTLQSSWATWVKDLLNTSDVHIAFAMLHKYTNRIRTLSYIEYAENGKHNFVYKSISDYFIDFFEQQPACMQYITILKLIFKNHPNIRHITFYTPFISEYQTALVLAILKILNVEHYTYLEPKT